MELHAVLRELVDAQGAGVLDDPSVFRGMLDDYLDESAATTGEINLLVDAVRFGALPALTRMIDSGAQPERAVLEAGALLTRERGGDDTRSGSWAVAVLGYALGRVPEQIVRQHPSPSSISTHAPAAAAPATAAQGTFAPAATQWPAPAGGAGTAAPTGAPAPAAGLPPTGLPHPGGATGLPHSGGTGLPHSGGAPGAGGPGGPSWPPPGAGPSKRRPVVLVAAVAVVLVVVVGGLVGFLATRGDDGSGGEAGGGGTSDAPEVDTSVEAVNERYAALGQNVAGAATECTPAEPTGDMTEALDCALPVGTLRLVTYTSATGLETARNRVIDQREGTIQERGDDGAFYSFDPANSGSDEPAQVYWDSYQGLQSAQISGAAGNDAAAVTGAFRETNPTVAAPTEPTDPELIEFLDSLGGIKSCERVASYNPEVLQEHQCRFKTFSVFAGRFDNIRRLKLIRQDATDLQAESDVYPADDNIYNDANANGTQDPSEVTIGVVRGYTIQSDTGHSAVLYIDKSTCRCYVEIWDVAVDGGEPTDPEVLADHIFG